MASGRKISHNFAAAHHTLVSILCLDVQIHVNKEEAGTCVRKRRAGAVAPGPPGDTRCNNAITKPTCPSMTRYHKRTAAPFLIFYDDLRLLLVSSVPYLISLPSILDLIMITFLHVLRAGIWSSLFFTFSASLSSIFLNTTAVTQAFRYCD